ncbi:MAG: CDP-glycerol glycerophosphotransferase family protein [Lachnospiraceae bacterium]|nr:CDP-glycerol glycerophosphotransferase family protein [Lachnospiraceae bacterium]
MKKHRCKNWYENDHIQEIGKQLEYRGESNSGVVEMQEGKIYFNSIFFKRAVLIIEGEIQECTIGSLNRSFFLADEDKRKYAPMSIEIGKNDSFRVQFHMLAIDNGNPLAEGKYRIVVLDKGNEINYIYSKEEAMDEDLWNQHLLIQRGKDRYTADIIINSSEEKPEIYLDVSFKDSSLRKEIQEKSRFVDTHYPFLKGIYYICSSLHTVVRKLPWHKRKLLFASSNRNSWGGCEKSIYNRMKERKMLSDLKISQFFRKVTDWEECGWKRLSKLVYHLATCDLVFSDGDFEPIDWFKFPEWKSIVQVGHISDDLELAGKARINRLGMPPFLDEDYNKCTFFPVASLRAVFHFAEAYGLPTDRFLITGDPCSDTYLDSAYREKAVESILSKYPEIRDRHRVYLYAPMFRGSDEENAWFPEEKIHYDEWAEFLKEENSALLIKMHPYVKEKISIPEEYRDFIIDVSRRKDDAAFFLADLLITDYSNEIFRFAFFQKPMLFYPFDLDEYSAIKGFYDEYMDTIPGEAVFNIQEIIEKIRIGSFKKSKLEDFHRRNCKYMDGKSTDRLIDGVLFNKGERLEKVIYTNEPIEKISGLRKVREKIKVSVIMPAYNAEKYIRETLDSVLNQTLDGYEVIVVDDGSSDNTPFILDEYASAYDFLRVIHKENEGPGPARNLGMDLANGEYYFFFDADDLLEYDALDALYYRAKEFDADIVVAKYDMFDQYSTTAIHDLDVIVRHNRIEKFSKSLIYTFSLCNKLFRSRLIEENQFRIPKLKYAEDGVFTLSCIYKSNMITGLNKVIMHYRRMFEGEMASLTSKLTLEQIEDYISAYNLIISKAKKALKQKFGDTSRLKKEEIQDCEHYIQEIRKKEIRLIFNQMFNKYWHADLKYMRLIVDNISRMKKELSEESVTGLQEILPEYFLNRLWVEQKDVLENAIFTIALFVDQDNKNFFATLRSIIGQQFVFYKIILPQYVKCTIKDHNIYVDNIQYISCEDYQSFVQNALEVAHTEYVAFPSIDIVYTQNALRKIYNFMCSSSTDFVSECIFHTGYGTPQPLFLQKEAFDTKTIKYSYNEKMVLDEIMCNKFFRTSFLKQVVSEKWEIRTLFEKGYYSLKNDGIVIYSYPEEEFPERTLNEEGRRFAKQYLYSDQIESLKEQRFERSEIEKNRRLLLPVRTQQVGKIQSLYLRLEKRMPLKKRVAFVSLRMDNALGENSKALYSKVCARKTMCVGKTPHDIETRWKFYQTLATSKVVVVDDYLWYLRYFPMRKEQMVIQIWHAAGVFKKFGQRGTNLPIYVEKATHSQYNLVCVSSDYVRQIYADAFDLELAKVQALGVPRTDLILDRNVQEEIRKKIFTQFSEWAGKQIILYAPTFRDVGEGRKVFRPEIDFEKLSKALLPNQLFIICPHPVMENKIIEEEYDNIYVMREYTTNDMMYIADLLVTDYSSVIFDFSLLRKPMVFFCYDYERYERGFYLDYEKDLPGHMLRNQEELTDYLRKPNEWIVDEKMDLFTKKYMSACDGHSSERIAGLIEEYLR